MSRIGRLAPLLLLAAAPLLAQAPPAGEAEAETGTLALLVPEVRAMGAPDWIRPGLRLTFYGAAAVVRQSGYQLVEDPAGDWEDPKTGKRYRKTDDDPRPGDDAGASGDGYSQFDVVSVTRKAVALNGTLYTVNRTDNTFIAAPLGGTLAHAACALDLWVHPAALAKLPLVNREGIRILKGRIPGTAGPLDVVYVVSSSGGARSSWTYDLASGVLLASNTSTPGKPAPVHLPNQPPPSGPTQLTFTRFVSARTTGLPAGGPLPEWVKPGARLDYAGVMNITNPIDPSTGSVDWPMALAAAVERTGPGFAIVRSRMEVRMQFPSTSEATLAGGPFSLFWIEPRLLATMKPGAVLDEDPVTRFRVGVAGAGGGAVTIDTVGPGNTTRATYDAATGRLASIVVQTPATGTTIRLSAH